MKKLFILISTVAINFVTLTTLTPIYASTYATITAMPATVPPTNGTDTQVKIYIDGAGKAFNAVGGTISTTGLKIDKIDSGDCNLDSVHMPTPTSLHFDAAILQGWSKGCTGYILSVQTLTSQPGTVKVMDQSVKSYDNHAELTVAGAKAQVTPAVQANNTANSNLELYIIAIVAILILIAGLGYYAYTKKRMNGSMPENVPPVATPPTTPVV